MTTHDLQSLTIKEIVTQNYQTAAVFEKYSLDFCCRGGKTIEQACGEKGVEPSAVFGELSTIAPTSQSEISRYAEWSPEFLIDYIVSNHHAYVRKMIPVIYAHTQKVASVHGANHPEVVKIAQVFANVAAEFQLHMRKEEQMLFPYIKQLVEASREKKIVEHSPFGSVNNPIRMMEAEHQAAGDEMYEIRSLSNGYTPPEDACTTYRITYQELQEFENDLHQHVHLENNILFPQAMQLEQEMFVEN
ncbi:MAG: iron-sulfur cluster repair di-iron protein [Bacteroidota bacterium]|nr:iron-sulfur cluster repair di-iron protein [Bacteroidota bacterium]